MSLFYLSILFPPYLCSFILCKVYQVAQVKGLLQIKRFNQFSSSPHCQNFPPQYGVICIDIDILWNTSNMQEISYCSSNRRGGGSLLWSDALVCDHRNTNIYSCPSSWIVNKSKLISSVSISISFYIHSRQPPGHSKVLSLTTERAGCSKDISTGWNVSKPSLPMTFWLKYIFLTSENFKSKMC